MTPRPRFVARSRHVPDTWVVYDDLRGYTVTHGNTASVAQFIARNHEATWRARCDDWQQAEHREGDGTS